MYDESISVETERCTICGNNLLLADQISKTLVRNRNEILEPFGICQFWRNRRLVKKFNSQIQHRSTLLVLGAYCFVCLKQEEADYLLKDATTCVKARIIKKKQTIRIH